MNVQFNLESCTFIKNSKEEPQKFNTKNILISAAIVGAVAALGVLIFSKEEIFNLFAQPALKLRELIPAQARVIVETKISCTSLLCRLEITQPSFSYTVQSKGRSPPLFDFEVETPPVIDFTGKTYGL